MTILHSNADRTIHIVDSYNEEEGISGHLYTELADISSLLSSCPHWYCPGPACKSCKYRNTTGQCDTSAYSELLAELRVSHPEYFL